MKIIKALCLLVSLNILGMHLNVEELANQENHDGFFCNDCDQLTCGDVCCQRCMQYCCVVGELLAFCCCAKRYKAPLTYPTFNDMKSKEIWNYIIGKKKVD